jgi:hypothetical protein
MFGATWSFVGLCFTAVAVDDDKWVVVVEGIERFGEGSLTLVPNKPEKLEDKKKNKSICILFK